MILTILGRSGCSCFEENTEHLCVSALVSYTTSVLIWFILCKAETWCCAAEAAAHLTLWARPAGPLAQTQSGSPDTRLGTSTCQRPPLLPRWWSSCHQRPGAWGEPCVVWTCTTGSSSPKQRVTPLCTAGAHSHPGRCLAPEASRRHWPPEILLEQGRLHYGLFHASVKCTVSVSDRGTLIHHLCWYLSMQQHGELHLKHRGIILHKRNSYHHILPHVLTSLSL